MLHTYSNAYHYVEECMVLSRGYLAKSSSLYDEKH